MMVYYDSLLFISTALMLNLSKYFQGYPRYKKTRVDGGCCTGPQTFHERCYCDASLDVCKFFCDNDAHCQGYVGEGANLCQMATTSSCPSKDCDKHSLGVIGTLDPDAKCGSRLDGCFIKEIGMFQITRTLN